jgi:hypothetical protein
MPESLSSSFNVKEPFDENLLMQDAGVQAAFAKLNKYISPEDHGSFLKILLKNKYNNQDTIAREELLDAIKASVKTIKSIKNQFKQSASPKNATLDSMTASLKNLGIQNEADQAIIFSQVKKQLVDRKITDIGLEINKFRTKVSKGIDEEKNKEANTPEKKKEKDEVAKFLNSISLSANALKLTLGGYFKSNVEENVEKRARMALATLEKIYNIARTHAIDAARKKLKEFHADLQKISQEIAAATATATPVAPPVVTPVIPAATPVVPAAASKATPVAPTPATPAPPQPKVIHNKHLAEVLKIYKIEPSEKQMDEINAAQDRKDILTYISRTFYKELTQTNSNADPEDTAMEIVNEVFGRQALEQFEKDLSSRKANLAAALTPRSKVETAIRRTQSLAEDDQELKAIQTAINNFIDNPPKAEIKEILKKIVGDKTAFAKSVFSELDKTIVLLATKDNIQAKQHLKKFKNFFGINEIDLLEREVTRLRQTLQINTLATAAEISEHVNLRKIDIQAQLSFLINEGPSKIGKDYLIPEKDLPEFKLKIQLLTKGLTETLNALPAFEAERINFVRDLTRLVQALYDSQNANKEETILRAYDLGAFLNKNFPGKNYSEVQKRLRPLIVNFKDFPLPNVKNIVLGVGGNAAFERSMGDDESIETKESIKMQSILKLAFSNFNILLGSERIDEAIIALERNSDVNLMDAETDQAKEFISSMSAQIMFKAKIAELHSSLENTQTTTRTVWQLAKRSESIAQENNDVKGIYQALKLQLNDSAIWEKLKKPESAKRFYQAMNAAIEALASKNLNESKQQLLNIKTILDVNLISVYEKTLISLRDAALKLIEDINNKKYTDPDAVIRQINLKQNEVQAQLELLKEDPSSFAKANLLPKQEFIRVVTSLQNFKKELSAIFIDLVGLEKTIPKKKEEIVQEKNLEIDDLDGIESSPLPSPSSSRRPSFFTPLPPIPPVLPDSKVFEKFYNYANKVSEFFREDKAAQESLQRFANSPVAANVLSPSQEVKDFINKFKILPSNEIVIPPGVERSKPMPSSEFENKFNINKAHPELNLVANVNPQHSSLKEGESTINFLISAAAQADPEKKRAELQTAACYIERRKGTRFQILSVRIPAEAIAHPTQKVGTTDMPSDAYLKFVDKQITAFIAEVGSHKTVYIKSSTDENKVKAYILVCMAKGLNFKNNSSFNVNFASDGPEVALVNLRIAEDILLPKPRLHTEVTALVKDLHEMVKHDADPHAATIAKPLMDKIAAGKMPVPEEVDKVVNLVNTKFQTAPAAAPGHHI